VLVLDEGVDVDAVRAGRTRQLDEHQKIRRAVVWPEAELPRTEGTRKLKRAAIRDWGAARLASARGGRRQRRARGAGRAPCRTRRPVAATTLEELGLSSLDRVELMVALEDAFQDADRRERVFARRRSGTAAGAGRSRIGQRAAPPEPVDFPTWTRSWWARATRRINLPLWILPLARAFAWLTCRGREHLGNLEGPVIFASNHQSFMDGPVIMAAMPAGWRYRRRTGDAQGDVSPRISFQRSTRVGMVSEQSELLPARRSSSTRFRCRSAKRALADAQIHRRTAREGRR
jgi:long-chain acyl-CoA synthetase